MKYVGTGLIYCVLDCIIQAAGVYVISRIYLGYKVGVIETYRICTHKIFSILAIVILSSMSIFVGLILLVIPGLIAYVFVFLAIPVFMIEGTSGWPALIRSRELVRGKFFTILGFILLTMLVGGVFDIAVSALIPDSFANHLIIEQLLTQAVDSITSLALSVITVLLYFDIRVRNEGFDLEMLAASMESQSRDPSSKPDNIPVIDNPSATDELLK